MVSATIAADEPLRVEIPGGRVHIDRQLPFLLLHRRPADGGGAGTADLVLAEAAYVIAAGDEEHRGALDRLLGTIAEAKKARFGAFLLVELWASSTTEAGEGGTMTFTIHAPAHGAPAAVLEEFESALLAVQVGDLRARVEVSYDDDWFPAGVAPLGVRQEVVHLGLEVPAVHFDTDTGVLFPFELRELRQGLGRALKLTFYEFFHSCTTTRPASYQELGRRAMTDAVREVDRELADLSDDFDLLLHVTPVNGREAEAEFLESGACRAPEFLYRPRTVDPDRMKRRLYAIPIEEIEDPTLAHIFSEKRDELDRKLTLVTDRNTDRFLLGSRALYGDPDSGLRHLAVQVLEALEPPEARGGGAGDVERFAEVAIAELDRYRRIDPNLGSVVEIRDDIPGVMVSAGNLLIGSKARVPQHRIEPLVAHEIGAHVLTYHNGLHQPFRELHGGMAGYESLQEGLGVVSEFLVGGLDGGRLRQLAGRVMAAQSIIDGADFVETFDLLCREWGFNPTSAFDITMRIFRGGGFIKDVVYLRGLAQLLGYLGAGGSLERLYLGKIAHDHLHLIEELEWRSVLEPPRLLPRHLERPDVVERLERSRRGLSVLDLVEEAAA